MKILTFDPTFFTFGSECGNANQQKLVGYADCDWAGDATDRKSTTGFLFKVFGATVTWCTRKQNSVAVSSTKAEYVALSKAPREGVWLVNFLKNFSVKEDIFTIFEDNQSCISQTIK